MCDTPPAVPTALPPPLRGKATIPDGIADAILLDYDNQDGTASLKLVTVPVGQTLPVQGQPLAAPGTRISLSQFPPAFNGIWRVMPASDLLLLKICKCA
jgi:hypothetical protein